MYETSTELDWLQALLDASFAQSSEHLLSIMTDERRLSAARLAEDLTGVCILNAASVTQAGEPRVSALDGHFLHARWYFTTSGQSPKAQQWRAHPAISASHTPRDGYGVFCHGAASFLDRDTDEFQEFHDHCVKTYGESPDKWGSDIAYLRIDPRWMTAFAIGSVS